VKHLREDFYVFFDFKLKLVGGFNPSEKYESQIGSSSQLLGKIKNVPDHQPVKYSAKNASISVC
jgi:hypothetical protein